MRKAKKTLAPQPAGNTISGCSFVNEAAPVNEHASAAAVALAKAAEANANAIAAIAKCLTSPSIHNEPMIYIGSERV